MEYSGNQIKKLGKRIRNSSDKILDEDLNQLQSFRTSFNDDLIEVFNIVCTHSRKVNREAIVTFRLKRFESIIAKLIRFPEMQLNTMIDIAGCRCIVKFTNHIYDLIAILKDNLIVLDYKDYIKDPKPDGYSSYHLFVKLHEDSNKVIEIQIRNQKQHDWATLVEITDLIFDEKIKENNSISDLGIFHQLLSRQEKLSFQEKEQIFSIINNHDYLNTINRIFINNQIEVRKQWMEIKNKGTHSYFILEANKKTGTKISSFSSLVAAESEYFDKYKENSESNIVLTHLLKANFERLSIAYSNYILTIPRFFIDIDKILKGLLQDSLEKKKIRTFSKYFKLYWEISLNTIINYRSELQQLTTDKSANKQKKKEWKKEIDESLKGIQKSLEDYNTIFKNHFPANIFHRRVFIFIAKRIARKYNAKMK